MGNVQGELQAFSPGDEAGGGQAHSAQPQQRKREVDVPAGGGNPSATPLFFGVAPCVGGHQLGKIGGEWDL